MSTSGSKKAKDEPVVIKTGVAAPTKSAKMRWPFRELKAGSKQYFEVPKDKRSSVSSCAARLLKSEGMKFTIKKATDYNGHQFIGCWRLK